MTPQTWAASLLQRLGIPQTPGAIKAVVGWEAAEGGHWNNTAKFNPLNTTQPAPGAGNTGTQGNIKVYTSWDQGLTATVQTLQNGRYTNILTALKAGDAGQVATAIGSSPWGTSGALVAKTIGSSASPSGKVAPAASSSQPTASAGAQKTVTAAAGNTLFGADKQSDVKYAVLWVAAIVAGLALAGIGLNRTLGNAPSDYVRRRAQDAKQTAQTGAQIALVA